MRTVLLCEGKTDAILISYLLCKTSGWCPAKPEKGMRITVNEAKNESAYWYNRNDDSLLICGVGGKDNFKDFFSNKIYDMIRDYPQEKTFDKIIIVQDKDTETVTALENKIANYIHPIDAQIKNDQWIVGQYNNSFNNSKTVNILGLIIPFDNDGALETVLLESLKEENDKKEIVERSELFVDEMKICAEKYISNPRMVLKAKLGVVFAVLSPMKVFSFIDEIIKAVEWEKSESLKTVFSNIINL